MIYKITITGSFKDAVDKLKDIGSFCFFGNDFFICADKDISKLKFISDIIEINSDNYKMYSSMSKNVEKWCSQKLIEHELTQYEKTEECQAKLKQLNDILDAVESKETEGDKVVRTTNSKKRTTRKKKSK